MPEGVARLSRAPRGLLDTSVVIDLALLSAEDLPIEIAVSALTMAELATGPQAATNPEERARRIGLPWAARPKPLLLQAQKNAAPGRAWPGPDS